MKLFYLGPVETARLKGKWEDKGGSRGKGKPKPGKGKGKGEEEGGEGLVIDSLVVDNKDGTYTANFYPTK
jgi:hypothetical protein